MSDQGTPSDPSRDIVRWWSQFVDLLESPDGRARVSTEGVVEALLARSSLQRAIDGGAEVDLDSLAALDRRYRELAPALLDETRVELYRDDEPDSHWWWRVSELAGQSSEPPFVDIASIAARKGVHSNTVRAAIHAGELPARRLGRTFLVHGRDVDRWVPRPVGRPAKRRATSGDKQLDAFNAEIEAGRIERAHAIAQRLIPQATTGARCLAIAIDRYNHGAYHEALVWLDRARDLGLDRDRAAKAALVRSLALIQMGHSAEAAEELADLEAPNALRWRIKVALADALLAADRAQDAEDVVEAALGEHADVPELRYLAARIRFHDDRPAEALGHIIAFREARPDDGAGLILHGSILGMLGDISGEDPLYLEATNVFKQALPAEGHRARVKLALSWARLGEWRESLSNIEAVSDSLSPEITEQLIRSTLLGAASHGGPKASALAAAHAEEHLAQTAMTRIFVALDLGTRGWRKDALSILDKDVSNEIPEWPDLDCWVGLAYLSLGEPQRAIARLRRFAYQAGSPSFALVLWGQAAAAAGEYDQARSAIEMLRDEESGLGLLANLAIEVIEHRGRERLQPAQALRDVAGLLISGGAVGSLLRLPWDLEHRDVSPIAEQGLMNRGS